MKEKLAFALLAASMAFFFACGRNAEEPWTKPTVNLNKTLTNELSDTSSLKHLDRDINIFMRKWGLRGVSLSVMRNDSLLFSKGYGWADEEAGEAMTPGHIMRVASVSKLLTATGIMVLCEQGKLKLKDQVFGADGILNDIDYINAINDKRYYKITVENLLRHEAGFTSRFGDPMFSTRVVMMQNHLTEAPDHNTLVKCMLKKRLRYMPGTSQEYSNFGYLLLSMIIEKVTGESYEKWMQDNVLDKAGCVDMHIGGTYFADRRAGEAKYYPPDNEPEVEEYNNSGRMVQRCYGGSDLHGLSGAGAWTASSAELALFVASIDGRDEIPDIISKESVLEMTRYYDDGTFSLGWNDTKPQNGWTRTGTLSGTSALIKYFPDGWCWVMITNTSTWKGPRLARYHIKALFNNCKAKYGDRFPAKNLFYDQNCNNPAGFNF